MKEITLEAVPENVRTVTEFVNAELERLDCPGRARRQVDVAVDELFGNIARYAYAPGTGPATVRVETAEDPPAVIITFLDKGVKFNPLAREDPDISRSVEERGTGGLGIYLVKKTMDELSYEYRDGKNILRIKKNLPEEGLS